MKITIQELSKSFGGRDIFNNFSLEVDSGVRLCVCGPNGTGKSTLLRMIAGLETPSTGHIYLDDEDVTKLAPYKRNVNMVFQHYALFPHMTVEDNIRFGLMMKKVPKEEQQERIDQVLYLTQLENLRYRKPQQMSGGQKQQGKSFLARRQEIVHLTEEVQGLEKLLQQQEKELDAITQKGKEQRQAQDDCLAELQKLAVRRAGLETQAEQKQKERQEKQEALELLREEKRSQTAEFLKLVEQRKQLEPQVAAMEQADAREKSESQELEAQLGKQRQDLEQASGRYQDALVEASGLKTQLEALNQRIQTMDSYEEKTQQELSDNEAQQAKQVQSQKDKRPARSWQPRQKLSRQR